MNRPGALRLAPLLYALGCPSAGEPDDSPTPTPDTDEGETDTDLAPSPPGDTGKAMLAWVGAFEASGPSYVNVTFGFGFYGLDSNDWVCTATGKLPYAGAAPAGCPDCAWAWDLGEAESSGAVGDYCESGQIRAGEGAVDGRFDYAWGFTERYTYLLDGTPLYFENAVLLYTEGEGWFAFAFTYPAFHIYQTYGDASSVSLFRLIRDEDIDSYVYYTYYP